MSAIEEVQKRIESVQSQIEYEQGEERHLELLRREAATRRKVLERLLAEWREIQARVA